MIPWAPCPCGCSCRSCGYVSRKNPTREVGYLHERLCEGCEKMMDLAITIAVAKSPPGSFFAVPDGWLTKSAVQP